MTNRKSPALNEPSEGTSTIIFRYNECAITMTNKNTLPKIMSIVIAALLVGISILWIKYQNTAKELETTTTSLIFKKAEHAKLQSDINSTKYCLSLLESGSTDFTVERCKLMLGE